MPAAHVAAHQDRLGCLVTRIPALVRPAHGASARGELRGSRRTTAISLLVGQAAGMGRLVASTPGVLVCQRRGRGHQPRWLGLQRAGSRVREGDVIELGRRSLRFLETPHVHHWDP